MLLDPSLIIKQAQQLVSPNVALSAELVSPTLHGSLRNVFGGWWVVGGLDQVLGSAYAQAEQNQ